MHFVTSPTASLDLGITHAGLSPGGVTANGRGPGTQRHRRNRSSAFSNPTPRNPWPWTTFQVAKMRLNQRLRRQK